VGIHTDRAAVYYSTRRVETAFPRSAWERDNLESKTSFGRFIVFIVPTLCVGMQPLTLQRLHCLSASRYKTQIKTRTLERPQTHSNAERWNDAIFGIQILGFGLQHY